MEKTRLQMTELEWAGADRDEARQEALSLRAALADLVAAAEKLDALIPDASDLANGASRHYFLKAIERARRVL